MIDRVEVFLRDDSDLRAISPEAADMVKQLDEDRVTLRPYWDQIDLVIGWQSRANQRIYRGYQGLSPTAQKQMTTWVDSDSMAVRNAKENNRIVVNDVQKAISDQLERAMLGNRDIRDALVRQEYTVTKQLIRIQAKEAEREAVGVTPLTENIQDQRSPSLSELRAIAEEGLRNTPPDIMAIYRRRSQSDPSIGDEGFDNYVRHEVLERELLSRGFSPEAVHQLAGTVFPGGQPIQSGR